MGQIAVKLIAIGLSLLAISEICYASGQVEQLYLQDNHVVFSLKDLKQHTLPSCVLDAEQNKWTMTLATEGGRTVYSVLLIAMSEGKRVSVVSAGDCAEIDGIEHASTVTMDLSN